MGVVDPEVGEACDVVERKMWVEISIITPHQLASSRVTECTSMGQNDGAPAVYSRCLNCKC